MKECERNGGVEFNHDVVKRFSSDQHVECTALKAERTWSRRLYAQEMAKFAHYSSILGGRYAETGIIDVSRGGIGLHKRCLGTMH